MNFGGWHRERARLSLIGLNRSRHTSRPPTGLQRESSAHSPADEFLKFVCQEQADCPYGQRPKIQAGSEAVPKTRCPTGL
jgi:hypothetical protein